MVCHWRGWLCTQSAEYEKRNCTPSELRNYTTNDYRNCTANGYVNGYLSAFCSTRVAKHTIGRFSDFVNALLENHYSGPYSGPQKVDHSGHLHLLRLFAPQPPRFPAR